MKKFFLSAFVVITFVAYALHQRFGDSEESTVIAPKTQQNTNQVISSPNPGSSSISSGSPPPTPIKSSPSAGKSPSIYKDGEFTGDVADAYYGNVQVKAVILGGKIVDVQFLDYPQDRNTSRRINSQAMPYLTQEAVQAQSAQVDIVSGATQTSRAFRESLQSALDKAKN